MILEAVRRVLYWDVDRAVALGAVGAYGRAMYWAVTNTVSQAMSRARRGAGAQREESLHPGLGLYLGVVG